MKFCNRKIYLVLLTLLMSLSPLTVLAQASYWSSSYVIYDDIHHTFDGPTITPGTTTVDGTSVTITWTTNVLSDSFVVYSTDSSFTDSHEQGTSAKTETSHSVEVTGLEEETTYYYKVKSTRINGGTTEGTSGTFLTETAGAGTGTTEPTPTGGGGGIIVIDKTDKVPPVITDIGLQVLGDSSVQIYWTTDEEATSFVEYGFTVNYGNTYGQWEYVESHSVVLRNLQAGSEYNFRVLSSDDSGNVAYSDNIVFSTDEGLITELPDVEEVSPPEVTEELSLFDFFQNLLPTLDDPNRLLNVESIDDLSNLIPIPILSGSPRIEVGANQATVYWATDREANSTVAIAPEEIYNPNATEPYQQIVGNNEDYVREHEVTILNLEPNTLYHYQLRSKSRFGPMISSSDFTFRTSLEELEITSFFTTIVDDQTAIFRWITNKASDSAVRLSPYHGNVVAGDEQKVVIDNAISVIHEITITDFEGGVFYEVVLASEDELGNVATETLPRFSTSEEDLPPTISHIKTDSTVFVDRTDKIQTIISWVTNEPSSSQVYYQEGVHGGDAQLVDSTPLNSSFTKEHVVVISNFDPGKVYTFRVESSDSGGNTTISKVHTFMTAKKKESIITIIINILENTFGWAKQLIPQ